MAQCDIVIACSKAKGCGFVCVWIKRGLAVGAGLFQHMLGLHPVLVALSFTFFGR